MLLTLRFSCKSEPTQLRALKPSYGHSCGSPEFPNQTLMKIGRGVYEIWSNYKKQTNKGCYFIYVLAWEPSAAKVTKSYYRRAVYPHLIDFYRETKYLLLMSTHSTWNLKTQLRTFPWLSWVFQSKFEANRSRGFWVMIGQTNKQTDKQRLQLYI